jgi:hypothetical protein
MNQSDFEEFLGDALTNADKMPTLLAPTAYGKVFMIHYAIQVSLKHPGIFSQPTQLEIDINLDTSRKDHKIYEHLLSKVRERVNKLLLLNGPNISNA